MQPVDPRVRAALALLGLRPGASRTAVTGAYRRLAKETHPDVSGAADAADRFAVIAAAYRQALGSTPEHVDRPGNTRSARPFSHVSPSSDAVVAGPVQVEPPHGEGPFREPRSVWPVLVIGDFRGGRSGWI